MTRPQPESDSEPTITLRQQVSEGLLHAHSWLTANTSKSLEASAFLYALVELLNERGVIQIDELDTRKDEVAKRLAEQLRKTLPGVMLQSPEYDKYTFDQEAKIDCASLVQYCHAACCRLPFALSRQDLQEGLIRWDLGQPYLIEHGADGYCTHLDRETFACTVRETRPVPCRGFDCRQDSRIWVDFEHHVPNPAIDRPDWPQCLSADEA